MVDKQYNRRELLASSAGLGILSLGASKTALAGDGTDYEFYVEVIETNAPIVWGETLEFTVEVENRGYDGSSQTIAYEVQEAGAGGRTIDDGSSSTSLDGWQDTTIDFSVDTEKRDSDRRMLIRAISEDRRNSESVTFEATQDAEFALEFVEVPEEAPENEDLEFDIDIENLGHESDSQELTVTVGNEMITGEEIELEWRETTEHTVTFPAESLYHGTRELVVETEDHTITDELDVLEEPSFQFDTLDIEPAPTGEPIQVESRIMNVGEVEGEAELELDVEGFEEEVTDSLTIESIDADTVELELGTDEVEPGEYAGTFRAGDAVEEITVEVLEPALTIEDVDSNAPLNPDDELDVEITLENDTQQDITEEIQVEGPDIGSEMIEVTVGEESEVDETVTFEELSGLEDGEYDLTVTSAADESELSVELSEDEEAQDGGTDDADDQGPGFGAVGAVAGVASLSYLLKRRLEETGSRPE